MSTGFCGLPISVTVSVSPARPQGAPALKVYGELGLATQLRFAVGQTLTHDDLAPVLRVSDEAHSDVIRAQPLMEAEPCSSPGEYIFDHTKVAGWNYNWVGSKHTSDLEHAFIVYVCEPRPLGKLLVLGAFKSPQFTIYCRRRHNTVPLEEKVALARPRTLEESTCVVRVGAEDGHLAAPALSLLPPQPPTRKRAAAAGSAPSSKKDRSLASSVQADADTAAATTDAAESVLRLTKRSPSPASSRAVADKLARVLATINKLEELAAQQPAPEPPLPSSPHSDDVNDFFDLVPLWPSVDPVSSGDEMSAGSLEDALGDSMSLDAIVGMLDPPRSSRALEVVNSLANYFVTETELTNAISSRTSLASFEAFLDVVSHGISNFLQVNFNMTLDDLDALLKSEGLDDARPKSSGAVPSMRTLFDTLVAAAMSRATNAGPSAAVPGAPLPPGRQRVVADLTDLASVLPDGLSLGELMQPTPLAPGAAPPDLAGRWSRPDIIIQDMEKMRATRHVDWIQRQLLALTERRFEISQDPATPAEFTVFLSRKLMSPGLLKHRLDGVARPMRLQTPLGSAHEAKTTQAWANGPVAILRNEYNDVERMYRMYWKRADGTLTSLHVYESLHGKGWGGATSSSSSSGKFDIPQQGDWKVNRVLCAFLPHFL